MQESFKEKFDPILNKEFKIREFKFSGVSGADFVYLTHQTNKASNKKFLKISGGGPFREMKLDQFEWGTVLELPGNLEEKDLLVFFHELYLKLYDNAKERAALK